MYDASSRKDIRLAEKAADRLASDRLAFLQAALTSREGRAWFYHFLADCQCFHVDPTFDPHRDYFIQGMKNVGMRIFSEIKTHCPQQYILMEQEENVRILAATAERSRSQDAGRNAAGRNTPDLDLYDSLDDHDGNQI